MTKFRDGPAAGKVMMLRRSPKFLRVTEYGGAFDALDQTDDFPQSREKIYAYRLVATEGMVHVNFGRKGGGFYPISAYEFVPQQPDDSAMRYFENWKAWCRAQAAH